MVYTALAVIFEGICHSHNFTLGEQENPKDFKDRIKVEMEKLVGGEIDEIFVFPCGGFTYHFDAENGW